MCSISVMNAAIFGPRWGLNVTAKHAENSKKERIIRKPNGGNCSPLVGRYPLREQISRTIEEFWPI